MWHVVTWPSGPFAIPCSIVLALLAPCFIAVALPPPASIVAAFSNVAVMAQVDPSLEKPEVV